jgi:hypothetical protein
MPEDFMIEGRLVMNAAFHRSALIALTLALAGCGSAETPAQNSLTQDENDRLNQIAEKLNQTSPPPRLTEGELPKAPVPPAAAPE